MMKKLTTLLLSLLLCLSFLQTQVDVKLVMNPVVDLRLIDPDGREESENYEGQISLMSEMPEDIEGVPVD